MVDEKATGKVKSRKEVKGFEPTHSRYYNLECRCSVHRGTTGDAEEVGIIKGRRGYCRKKRYVTNEIRRKGEARKREITHPW